jgi:DNA-binding NarL/FixJ family response regulator
MEVLTLAMQGMTIHQMGDQLGLSFNTVKVHLRLAYRRLGIRKRLEAVNLLMNQCPHCGGHWGLQ